MSEMDEIQDPTIRQPLCQGCGLPIRSTSFELQTPHYRHEVPGTGGMVVMGTAGIPAPRPFLQRNRREGWLHDDPRGEHDHPIFPQEWEPHTHETDYERQMRAWRMSELEKKAHLGDQFK